MKSKEMETGAMPQNTTDLSEIFTLEWVIEGQGLLLDLKSLPALTDEMLAYQDRLIIAQLDTASQPVHLIVRMPPDYAEPIRLKQIISFKFHEHPRLYGMILIGLPGGPVTRFLMSIVSTVRRVGLKNFDTLEDGLAYVRLMNNA